MSTISNFSDIAAVYAEATANEAFDDAFTSNIDGMQIVGDEEVGELPEPMKAQLAIEMVVDTVISLLQDTRLERHADSIAWGIVNSFHKTAERIEAQADAEAMKLKDLLARADGSEISTFEIEETQARCKVLDEDQDALACMRDYASDIYAAKIGRPWSALRGSTVSSKRTASVVSGADFLAARAAAKREQRNPTGPVVLFSGGNVWHDWKQLHERLDAIKARIPAMTLVTTAQTKGCDAIAHAWAASRKVPVVAMTLGNSGKSAGFDRNRKMVALKPVEAIVCEGSGLQSNLWQLLRQAGVPTHAFKASGQAPMEDQRRA